MNGPPTAFGASAVNHTPLNSNWKDEMGERLEDREVIGQHPGQSASAVFGDYGGKGGFGKLFADFGLRGIGRVARAGAIARRLTLVGRGKVEVQTPRVA